MSVALLAIGCAATLFGLSLAAFHLALRPLSERPRFGRRGRSRARALRKRPWFRFVEPLLRFLSAGIEPYVPLRVRSRLERLLAEAGHPFGLMDTEVIGVAGVASLSFGGLLIASDFDGVSLVLVCMVTLAAGAAPFMRLSAAAKRRGTLVTRRLPAVLELIVMCMSAGLDLPRALRCVVESATDPFEPIVEELDAVVRELELGRTRKEALRSLAVRVPTPEVRELVNTVVQSEDKGISLSKTLTIQSRTLKLRRSMSAERAASSAALMLVGPMSLIFLCVIALLLGPVLIRMTAGGLG